MSRGRVDDLLKISQHALEALRGLASSIWGKERFRRRLRPLPSSAPARSKQRLVKSRPATLEQRYERVELEALTEEVFTRLKRRLYLELDRRAAEPDLRATVFREAGRMTDGRSYFYLKPYNERGFLFERYGHGWSITPADKIAGRDLFVRDRLALDAVELFVARDAKALLRVKATALGQELLSLPVYEQKLLAQLGLE